MLVDVGQRNPTLVISDEPNFDDRLRDGPQRRDHNRGQHYGSDSNCKTNYDIAAFEHVFQKSHSPLLSLATRMPNSRWGFRASTSTHIRKFLAERTTLRFDAVIINSEFCTSGAGFCGPPAKQVSRLRHVGVVHSSLIHPANGLRMRVPLLDPCRRGMAECDAKGQGKPPTSG
jgi:hypothetical protein